MTLIYHLLEAVAVLGYHKTLVSIWLPTFRDGLFVIFARVKQSSSWTVLPTAYPRCVTSLKTEGINYTATEA